MFLEPGADSKEGENGRLQTIGAHTVILLRGGRGLHFSFAALIDGCFSGTQVSQSHLQARKQDAAG